MKKQSSNQQQQKSTSEILQSAYEKAQENGTATVRSGRCQITIRVVPGRQGSSQK